MTEVQKLLKEEERVANTLATTHDLKLEIDNLKKEIAILKSNHMVLIKGFLI